MPDAQPGKPNPFLRANSLSELLLWHDLDFVRCAFVTVLGRQPDPTGEAYYLQRLRAGVSKLKLLSQLRNSREGRAHDPGIAGLDRALKRASWGRLPVIGWAARRVFRTEAEGRVATLQRAILNELGAIRGQMAALSTRRSSEEDDRLAPAKDRPLPDRLSEAQRMLPPSARSCFNLLIGAGDRADLD